MWVWLRKTTAEGSSPTKPWRVPALRQTDEAAGPKTHRIMSVPAQTLYELIKVVEYAIIGEISLVNNE